MFSVPVSLFKTVLILACSSTYPVPFIIVNNEKALHKGTLADITPTILKILDIKKPEEMTGESLIR